MHTDAIRNKNGIWINSRAFSEEAIHFSKYGYYTSAPWGSNDWMDYWKEQLRRCTEGHEINGAKITGHHYFYLNFAQIQITEQGTNKQKRQASKKQFFPDFWDGDYNYFWALEIARNGMSKKDYLDLNLDFQLDEKYLEGGYYMIVGKGRRKGYSYKNGAIAANTYNTQRRSLCILGAFDSGYLYPKGTMTMATNYLNFLNEHTGWKKSRDFLDKVDHRRASFAKIVNDTKVEAGTMSEVMAITFQNNPDAARGKDAALVLFEEAGKFPNLKDAFYATDDTLRDGRFITGQIVIFGTGGDMESGTVDFADMFYNPEEYNLLPFVNKWDEDASKTTCGFFHPSYLNKTGFYDEQGNSDIEKAIEHDNKEIEKRSVKGKGSTAAQKYKTENPNCPADAFKIVNTNDFPIFELNKQLNKIKADNLHIKYGQPCSIYHDTETGKPKVEIDLTNSVNIIWGRKEINEENKTGGLVIFEHPIPNAPKGLYKIGYDPYRQDEGESLACIIVYKGMCKGDYSSNEIVARYLGRPQTADEVNRIAELLTEFYNTELMYENEVTHVKSYFERRKKLYLLALQPNRVIGANVQSSKVARVYGCHMNDKLKDAGEKYIKQWLLEVKNIDENGKEILNLETLYDPFLIEELIKYNRKGNFDAVMAYIQVMFQIQEEELGYVYDANKELDKTSKQLLELSTNLYRRN
jgi:hypothetical protein